MRESSVDRLVLGVCPTGASFSVKIITIGYSLRNYCLTQFQDK